MGKLFSCYPRVFENTDHEAATKVVACVGRHRDRGLIRLPHKDMVAAVDPVENKAFFLEYFDEFPCGERGDIRHTPAGTRWVS